MLGISEYTLRGFVELLKFIGVVMTPIVILGAIALVLEKPKTDDSKKKEAGE